MDDLVAVAVILENADRRYFLTLGRVQDNVDPAPLEDLVLRKATGFDLGGTPVAAEVCFSLREASTELYFYECLAGLTLKLSELNAAGSQGKKKRVKVWKRVAKEMEGGRHLYYCGKPRPVSANPLQ